YFCSYSRPRWASPVRSTRLRMSFKIATQAMKPTGSLDPKTIQDLERCCAELFAVYHRAMEAANVLEQKARTAQREWARMQGEWLREAVRGNEPSADAKKIQKAALAERDRYERNRAKFRNKANFYRRQAETILKVLEWAAPDKYRAINEGRRTGALL